MKPGTMFILPLLSCLALLVCKVFGQISFGTQRIIPRFGGDFISYRGNLNKDMDTAEIDLQCPTGMTMQDKDGKPTCTEKKMADEEVTDYNLQLLLYNTNLTGSAESLRLKQGLLTFCEQFQMFANKINNISNVTNFEFNLGFFNESPLWWEKWNMLATPLYLSINFKVIINTTVLMGQIIDSIGNRIGVPFDGQDIDMMYKVFNGSYSMDVLVSGFSKADSSDSCSAEKVPQTEVMQTWGIAVFHEMSCQYAELYEGDDYRVAEGGLRLRFQGIELESKDLSTSDFTFHEEEMITICWETYKKYQLQTLDIIKKAKQHMRETLWIVNVLALSFSLVALFSTFVTYCTFPLLRTLPVKNNMCLIVSLFMAQLVYILGFRQTDNYVFCLTSAVALHYLWLAAIFWMSVCCFHVFKGFVLSKTVSAPSETHNRALFRYITFAHGVPILVILTVVVPNLILSEGKETGYVGRNCFLSSVLLNGLTVTLPLCLVLLSNFVFFTATICMISRTKQIRRNTGGERRNLWIYIKLSSITGLFWVVAILAAALQVHALEYVSTILNSCQGVFLFFSYCCNMRVLTLWRNKLTGETGDVSSNGTSKRTTLTRT